MCAARANGWLTSWESHPSHVIIVMTMELSDHRSLDSTQLSDSFISNLLHIVQVVGNPRPVTKPNFFLLILYSSIHIPVHLGTWFLWQFLMGLLREDKSNRCRYNSITQYLKRCLIKDDNNYMFRPIAVIIRFSSEDYGSSALWDWYGYVTMVRSQHLSCLLYFRMKT
jgi:hypothetical protein